MERAARLIKKKSVSREIVSDEDIARAVWPSAVGKAIERHTGHIKLVRRTLVVEVQDAVWQKQLHVLSRQIVARVRALTGSDYVEDVEFRIAIPRRQPQRAEFRIGTTPQPILDPLLGSLLNPDDEAERIQDPVLKKVYRLSRRKAIG